MQLVTNGGVKYITSKEIKTKEDKKLFTVSLLDESGNVQEYFCPESCWTACQILQTAQEVRAVYDLTQFNGKSRVSLVEVF